MPWDVKDVEKHRKGLTEKQKKKWVETANSVLAKCVKKGGTDKTCAPKAIRIANTVVGTNEIMLHINLKSDKYEVIRRKMNERQYILVPVILMVEGVHNGNQGPIFHSIEELGKIPEVWNGIPIVINHPETDGYAIPANSPEVLEEFAVGTVFNTFIEEKQLKATAWLDEQRLIALCPDVYERIMKGDPIEVSVGVFTDYDETEGQWNGETYNKVALNHRPDHLAILPDMVGACSLEDGCGLGVNSENIKSMGEKEIGEFVNILRLLGHSVNNILNNKKPGYKEILDVIYSVLYKMNPDNSGLSVNYLEELYDAYLIYVRETSEGRKFYKQDYKFEGGKVEFLGEPVEVRKEVNYINLSQTKKKEENKMAENCAPCVKKKIDELIANSQGRWTEDDRAFLETFDEKKLDKLLPVEKIVEKLIEKEVPVNVLSKEDQDALAAYKAEKKVVREQMVKDIQANSSKEMWPDEVLNAMSDENLKRIFNSVKKEEVVDYSLNANTNTQYSKGEVEPMLPIGYGQEPDKK